MRNKALIAALALVASTPLVPTGMATTSADVLLQKTASARAPRNAIHEITLTTTTKGGKVEERKVQIWIRVEGQELWSLARVLSPADVAGTQFLTRQAPGKAPDQLLYLPKLKKTNRVLAKRASLLGTDFSAADLDFSSWERSTNTVVGQETLTIAGQKIPCDLMNSVPPAGETPYHQARLGLSTSDGFPRRIEFQDAAGKVIKRWEILEVKVVEGIPVPARSVMETVEKGTRTQLVMDKVQWTVKSEEVPAEMFTAAWMESHP